MNEPSLVKKEVRAAEKEIEKAIDEASPLAAKGREERSNGAA
jgi:hypothetical protein